MAVTHHQTLQFGVVALAALVAFAETRGDHLVAVVSYLVAPFAALVFFLLWFDEAAEIIQTSSASPDRMRRLVRYAAVVFAGMSLGAVVFAVLEARAASWPPPAVIMTCLGGLIGIVVLGVALWGARDVLRNEDGVE